VKEKLPFIDFAKGIGILLVVWGHTQTPFTRSIYIFHMPLFFMLSGFLFETKSFSFAIKRIIKLLRLLFFYYILSYLFFYVINFFRGTPFVENSFFELFTGKELYRYNVPLWFLLSLIWVSTIYQMMSKIKNQFAITIICLIISYTGLFLSKNAINLPYYLDSSMSVIFFYHLGYLIKKYNLIRKYVVNNKNFLLIFSLLSIVGAFSYTSYFSEIRLDIRSNFFYINFLEYILINILILVSILILCNLIRYNRAINFLGVSSLVIMSVHCIFKGIIPLLQLDYFITNQHLLSIVEFMILTFLSVITILALKINMFSRIRYLFGIK